MVDTSGVTKRLEENRRRREAAEQQLDEVRDELASLLAQGHFAGLPVAVMARAAGISRQAAHKHLRKERS
jgi:hypothetical protein